MSARDSLFEFRPRKDEDDSAAIPAGFCPVCTKDLDADGWCFECREQR